MDLHALHDERRLRLHLRVRGHRLHGRHLHFNFLALATEASKGHDKRNDNRQTDYNRNDRAHKGSVLVNKTIILVTELGYVAV